MWYALLQSLSIVASSTFMHPDTFDHLARFVPDESVFVFKFVED